MFIHIWASQQSKLNLKIKITIELQIKKKKNWKTKINLKQLLLLGDNLLSISASIILMENSNFDHKLLQKINNPLEKRLGNELENR